ncbi:MAG: molecular chaperone [Pseudomonadales bacterium]
MSGRTDTVAGFDYGTSHCAIGLATPGRPGEATRLSMVPLEGDDPLIASTLFAPKADFELSLGDDAVLDMASQSFRDLRFGSAALSAYLNAPTEGYFVKSPKSFLGAPGLSERVKDRFISVVAAMMANVRQRAEAAAGMPVTRVVIGRPVNFQGAAGTAENQQALAMLVAAAREAGFEETAFLFEPMAAAFDFEQSLTTDQQVLVVDIGGGTTDCSFVRVGPERIGRRNREPDVLGHAGERLGGNDYDQALALKALMPVFGMGDALATGLPIANGYYVDAVSTNDVNAQQRFYGRQTGERFREILRDAVCPERFRRLDRLREERGSHRLLRQAELGKIDLSAAGSTVVDLGFVERGLALEIGRRDLEQGAERLLAHLAALVREVLNQGGARPDTVYLTGGMARSAVLRTHLAAVLGDVPLVDSDHFTSVTRGLTLWADRIFDG